MNYAIGFVICPDKLNKLREHQARKHDEMNARQRLRQAFIIPRQSAETGLPTQNHAQQPSVSAAEQSRVWLLPT